MRTKIVRTGNSRAVLLPVALLESQHWDAGDEIEVEELASGVVMRTPGKKSVKTAARRFVREHRSMLRELAKR